MKALVTGFDAFGDDAVNPSYEAVRRLPARIGTLEVVTAELPTSFARALPRLRALIKREQPDIVLCVGLAADRAAINVERIAVNLRHARIADNDGARPLDSPVVALAPAAFFSTLPVVPIVKALARAKLHAEMSMSAGTFVCNQVFYGLMHMLARQKRRTHAGFVHVPALSCDGHSGMPLQQMVRGLRVILETTQRELKTGRKAGRKTASRTR